MTKLSSLIKRELDKRGFESLKEAARFIGVSTEALRLTVNEDHIPKDRTLRIIANKLGLDLSELLVAAHREKVPEGAKKFFLSPVPTPVHYEKKRRYPLSQEQCDYLSKFMSPAEIQLVRKYRQFTAAGKTEILGYIDYHFLLHRAALQKVSRPVPRIRPV